MKNRQSGRVLVAMVLVMAVGSPVGAPAALAADVSAVKIDFSTAGYMGGGVAIQGPTGNFRVVQVKPTGGDDTALIQGAIDLVSSKPVMKDGFRGKVELLVGKFQVSGQLKIRASGVVVSGAPGAMPTIVATGEGRRALIDVREAGRTTYISGALDLPAAVTDVSVPAGGKTLTLANVTGLKAGDHVVVTRPCNKAWVDALTAEGKPLGWSVDSRELVWDRTIAAVDAGKKQVTLDAPITTALEQKFGGGTVQKVDPGIDHVGIQGLTLESAYDASNPKDENHSWFGINLYSVQDAWVRNVTFRHFAGPAVHVGPHGRRITVMSCNAQEPVSEVGGYRREVFYVEGQQVLVQDCTSEAGVNDFAVGLCAAGPNVFLNCTSKGSLGASGALESWASGVLFENVKIDGAGLVLGYQERRSPEFTPGWSAANSVVWNSTAKKVDAEGPKSAPNIVSDSKEPLYQAQLKARGLAMVKGGGSGGVGGGDGAGPTMFTAAMIKPATVPATHAVEVVGGRFVVDGKAVWGPVLNEGWWRGSPVPVDSQKMGGVNATHWVTGREGIGETDNLEEIAELMVQKHVPFYAAIPGLWYDRRRDDHDKAPPEQPDGMVVGALLEWPWARSGQGVASDGLSKFDLTKFNSYYFDRRKEMAQLCDEHGFVLIQHLYDSHDVLEIVPHWRDYPMRPLNNINNTGSGGGNIAEPPATDPTKGAESKNFHQANEVYDIDNPVLRDLHRRLIMHSFDVLGDQKNVVFSLSFQFVGPLKFQEFFMDLAQEWGDAHHKQLKIAIITNKDITDAILADPLRSKQVTMIDTRYWQYMKDGTLFAPPGGANEAFRESVQHAYPGNSDHPPPTTPDLVYKEVREYRDKYPQVAISAWNGMTNNEIPGLMAGASLVMMNSPFGGHGQKPGEDYTRLDEFVQKHLADSLMKMYPNDALSDDWTLADEKLEHVLVYGARGESVTLNNLPAGKAYNALWSQAQSGLISKAGPSREQNADLHAASGKTTVQKPGNGAWFLYLTAK